VFSYRIWLGPIQGLASSACRIRIWVAAYGWLSHVRCMCALAAFCLSQLGGSAFAGYALCGRLSVHPKNITRPEGRTAPSSASSSSPLMRLQYTIGIRRFGPSSRSEGPSTADRRTDHCTAPSCRAYTPRRMSKHIALFSDVVCSARTPACLPERKHAFFGNRQYVRSPPNGIRGRDIERSPSLP
jgi:hypothetical protein